LCLKINLKGEVKMARLPNTNVSGGGFSQTTIDSVWSKALIVVGYNSNVYRKDSCGAWIQKSEYGNTNSDYGWEVDHNYPVVLGGTDSLDNLLPLHWKNNRGKSDNYPKWNCTVWAT
jgi:hypothetical protein